jgi:hypothetical protein
MSDVAAICTTLLPGRRYHAAKVKIPTLSHKTRQGWGTLGILIACQPRRLRTSIPGFGTRDGFVPAVAQRLGLR